MSGPIDFMTITILIPLLTLILTNLNLLTPTTTSLTIIIHSILMFDLKFTNLKHIALFFIVQYISFILYNRRSFLSSLVIP